MKRLSDAALVDEGSAVGHHVDQRTHRDLPGGAVDRFRSSVENSSMSWTEPSAKLDLVADLVGPEAERFQLLDEIFVHLNKIARTAFRV